MTLLLKEKLMVKLTRFPTIEMGIYSIHTQRDRPSLIWRSAERGIVSGALSNASGMAARKNDYTAVSTTNQLHNEHQA